MDRRHHGEKHLLIDLISCAAFHLCSVQVSQYKGKTGSFNSMKKAKQNKGISITNKSASHVVNANQGHELGLYIFY